MKQMIITIMMVLATIAANAQENANAPQTGMACGIYVSTPSHPSATPLECQSVAYDKTNVSGGFKSALKIIIGIGGDIMSNSKAKEWIEKLNKEVFGVPESVLGITALMANSDIKTERLLVNGAHASTVIPQDQTAECTFLVCLDCLPADDIAETYLKEMAAHPENLKCIRLNSKKGGFRSFPKGLKLEALGHTIMSGKKGGTAIEFEIIPGDGENYQVKFKQPLTKGDYCFICNDSEKSLFDGKLFVYDFTVE